MVTRSIGERSDRYMAINETPSDEIYIQIGEEEYKKA